MNEPFSVFSPPSLGVHRIGDGGIKVWIKTGLAMLVAAFLLDPLSLVSAVGLGDPAQLPPPATAPVDFARDVWPILNQSCLRCHGPEKPKGRYRIDTREAALKGGENGPAILPGDSAKSPLIHFVARLVEDMEMPPRGKGDPVTKEQVALLRAWVDQGASWGVIAPAAQTTWSFSPSVRYVTVSGNEQKFRELYSRNPGWSGGYEELDIRHRSGDDEFSLQARGIYDESDYRLALEAKRRDLGFIRAGVENSRKYYDNSGGYFPLLSTAFYSLGRDLHTDRGRAWVDVGLMFPDRPHLTVGYEYQWRHGTESLLQWGFGIKGTDANGNGIQPFNIFPTSRDVDEQTHIVKVGLDYTSDGWTFEDQFRGEFHDSKTARLNTTLDDVTDATKAAAVLVRERYRSFTGMNTFRVEKQFAPWLLTSGGYLFSKLDGDSAFALDGQNVPGSLSAWRSSLIVLDRVSHVVNFNALLGPWEGFNLALGAQAESTTQTGLAGVAFNLVTPVKVTGPTSMDTETATAHFKESAALRYTRIAYTTLFAETSLDQEDIGLFERQVNQKNKQNTLLRDTDETGHTLDWRAGFHTSPASWVTLGAHFRQQLRDESFHHVLDADNGSPSGDGYSAFIHSRRTLSDGIEARLTLRPVSWLRAVLAYKLDATDYYTAFDRVKALGNKDAGGENFSGNYDAHIYSGSLLFTGVRNLQLSGTATYQDIRTITLYNTNALVAPYGGGVYSILAGATYYLGTKTDLSASYAISWSDFSKNNFNLGIPFGIRYEQHTVQAMLQRRITENVRVRLGYGFARYTEDTAGGLNDFTAHALFGGLTWRWP